VVLCVHLCVRTLKGKQLELSAQMLVQIYFMAAASCAKTRSSAIAERLCDALVSKNLANYETYHLKKIAINK